MKPGNELDLICLLGRFTGDLAELLAAALPSVSGIAVSATCVVKDAEKHLSCVLEAWEAVMMCKTQITDLYMDNDELSKRRQEDLLVDAAELLKDHGVIELDKEDSACVGEFLLGASKFQAEAPDAWQSILLRLRQDAGPSGQGTWAELAGQVLEELQDLSVSEQRAARRIQRAWARFVRAKALQRSSNAHELRRLSSLRSEDRMDRVVSTLSRSSMFGKRSARWSCSQLGKLPSEPEALSVQLLREGSRMLGQAPGIEMVTQFQRCCTALDVVTVQGLSPSAALAFWLNIRNLAVVVALLHRFTQPLSLPNTFEDWVSCLSSTSVFACGRPLTAIDIDHGVLGVGARSLLPAPGRASLVTEADDLRGFMPWPVFALWLPIEFGAPKLRIFRSENLLAQLRLAAEAFIESCHNETIRLPPSLRSCAAWQPLLKSRGGYSPVTTEASVNWALKIEALCLQ